MKKKDLDNFRKKSIEELKKDLNNLRKEIAKITVEVMRGKTKNHENFNRKSCF